MNKEYMKGKDAAKVLSVHQRTLYLWEKKGLIETMRTPGNMRLYNVKKYLEINNPQEKPIECNLDGIGNDENCRLNIIYARVSSLGQKDDLERQKALLKNKYPNHVLIEDIGSGINLNKRGIRKIIDLAISNKISEVVVVHKDRLARIGYELIEDLIMKYSNGTIKIIAENQYMTKEEELVRDVMEIMNVYIAKMNGMRKYKIKNEPKLKKKKA